MKFFICDVNLCEKFRIISEDIQELKNNKKETEEQLETIQTNNLEDIQRRIDEIKRSVSIDKFYPVGSTYLTMNETNPSELFGGKWEQIKDCFLFCSENSQQRGGNKKILEENLPPHSHHIDLTTSNNGNHTHKIKHEEYYNYFGGPIRNASLKSSQNEDRKIITTSSGAHTHSINGNTSDVGSGIDYMPPYLTVYAWYRIE